MEHLEILRAEIVQLKSQFQQAENIDDKINIKEKYLIKELELIGAGKQADSQSSSIFNPQKAHKIKGLTLEVIGLNYIPLIKGAYNILTGRGGSGKSAVALKSMIEYLQLNQDKSGLAFFTEDAIEDIKTRIKIICNSNNSNYNDIISRIHFLTVENDDRLKWVKKSRDEYVINHTYIDIVTKFCNENNIGFIILDPLKRFHSLSENSNDDMDVLVRDIFTVLAVKTNTVLLVLHHSAKNTDNGHSRGASTITDSARLGWTIGRYYIKNKDNGESVPDPSRENKISLQIIKDNNGIEKKCTIRNSEDMSIMNPLSGFFNSNNIQPQITTYKADDLIEIQPQVDIPDIF